MEEIVAGIKEEELSSLSLEILDHADRVSELFTQIDSCMEKLPACYQGPSAQKLLERYQELHALYPVVKRNLTSYSDDLMTLIKKMHAGDKQLRNLFREFTGDTKRQVKAHNFKLT